MGCRWYAELPQGGTGAAARPFTAVMPMTAVPMTATPCTVSTRSLTNDHKIGRPRVPGGPTG
jgi:hypothetical protein